MPKKRKRETIQPKPRLHIFCEGIKTEPNYITAYIELRFPGTRLSPVRKTDKNTPIQLVEEAIKAKRDDYNHLPDDEFWVVFDREAENKYPKARHAEARAKANASDIHIAFSNICFEVWILLHFQKNCSAYTSYSDLRKRSKLKTYIKGYDKGEKRIFSDDEITFARKNAIALNQHTKSGADPDWAEPYQWNPYTDVYELLDAIDRFGSQYIT